MRMLTAPRMRRNPRMLRCSHRRATGCLRKATPPRPAPPRPCRLEALLPDRSSSLPFPRGCLLSLAFLSLCSRTSRNLRRNPWPGLRGRGAGRHPCSSLPVRSERSERWEVVLGMEPSWVEAAPRGT